VASLYRARRMPVSRGSMVGRAALARRAVQVEDVATDPELVATHALSRASNFHTSLAVPLLLKGEPIGVIALTRTSAAAFDDKQVGLVEAFAKDQAVIAIENTRLFEADRRVNANYKSHSNTRPRPVRCSTSSAGRRRVPNRSSMRLSRVRRVSATRYFSVVWLYDGELLHCAARHNF